MIATMKADGSDHRLLTADACVVDGPPRAAYPDWSPDGRSIAFAGATGRLVVMRASDGAIRRRLHAFAGSLDWAPGGRRIAYASKRGDLNVIRSEGHGSPRRLVHTDAEEFSPAWSPNGKTIAFVRSLRAGEEEVRYGVFKVPARGGTAKRIFRTHAESLEETLESPTISRQPR